METKQVLVIRKDLNMRKGKIAAQAAHASVAVMSNSLIRQEKGFWHFYPQEALEEWLLSSFTKICVSVNSEKELKEIYEKALYAGLPKSIIQDSGKTEFNGVPTYTAVAVGPGPIEKVDKITGHLPLL